MFKKNKIALITAIFGDLDALKNVCPQSVPADKFCFTNSVIMPFDDCNGWKVIHPNYPRHDLHNRIKAKYFRTLSHTIKELSIYDIIIWIDASIEIINEEFISFMAGNIVKNDMSFFKHSARECIYEEAEFSKPAVKYANEPIDQQIQQYLSEKYPFKNGLIETGCFSRKINAKTNKIMEDWWMENIKYSYQDQISLPYVLWKNNFHPFIIDKNIHDNEYCFRKQRPIEKEML